MTASKMTKKRPKTSPIFTDEKQQALQDLKNLKLELQQLLQKIEEEKRANSSNDDTNSQYH